MDEFRIKGGSPLVGVVNISGAKNAVLPILAATLLTKFPVQLANVPDLEDVRMMNHLLISMGSEVLADFSRSTVMINTSNSQSCIADKQLVCAMRASILVLGPLLARFGHARVALPGGCAIGSRPVNLHLSALRALGASISIDDGYIDASVPGRLQGAIIDFDQVTVTGTENILMAAVLAEGTTVLRNAAIEPEVGDLARCLNKMGAKITGIDSPTLTIEGVAELKGVSYSVIPDRIEAGTYLVGALMTGGRVKVIGVDGSFLGAVIEKIEQAGGVLTLGDDWVQVDMRDRRPQAVDITTSPYPGFPTDMQAQFMAMNCIATGNSCVSEKIFENRFMHVHELSKMGAKITVQGDNAYTLGAEALNGTTVRATDLRASASLVLAACCAKGVTVIKDIYHIGRGYAQIEKKLAVLGVDIQRVAQLDCTAEFA